MTTIDTTPEAIAALLNGVTPGPWRVEHGTTLIWGHCDQDDATDRGMGYPVSECRITPVSSWARGPDADSGEANARFIAAARELVPALAAEIARLTAERDEARAQVAMAYEAAADACSEYPRSNPDYEEWVLYDEQTDHSMRCIRALTPADAAAALAARDAAMRNEGRRQAAAACDWGDIYGDNAVSVILATLEPEGEK